MCLKPFRFGVQEYGCGQCIPCRLNRRRIWTCRLMLEAAQHRANCFVTLTYDKEHLPKDGSLCVRDVQLFLKRLRERVSPLEVRYYVVGEYGDYTFRPHYHALLFGIDSARDISVAWGLGFVHVGNLTEKSASYVVGYVVKGLTKREDPRLKGRVPEFARMSLRPGIGAPQIGVVAEACRTYGGSKYVAESGDVPSVVRAGGSIYPLGRYLRGRIRVELDRPVGEPEVVGRERAIALQAEVEAGGRLAREELRVQVGRRAESIVRINRSKKGIGL